MDQLRQPGELSLQGNLAENWRKWKQMFLLYISASGIAAKTDEVKSAALLHIAGEDAVEIYNSFQWQEAGDEKTLNKDRVRVCDDQIRRRLLREEDLTLKKAVDICRASEATTHQMKSFTADTEKNLQTDRYHVLDFQVVDGSPQCLLGLESSQNLELIKRVFTTKEEQKSDILDEYKDVFEGLGEITDVTHHITVDPNVPPVIHPPRKLPVALRDRVQKELERMEKLNVIERVHEPTQWVNSMVTVIKPNKTRICIDPRDLNKAISREHFPMRTIEEVVSGMPKAKVFSVLDASSGFWQIKLDEESSKFCTFNTPFGRFKFNRLPFGICSAPEVFQDVMSQVYESIEGVEIVADDILIWGETVAEHDQRLRNVFGEKPT
ncbi:hypothetical protein BSL78_09434 [Apostichopus japonicus]|uniref:Reverse transcriptase domain-containing protein n=1 Tax=Stichopus japonicus TaxID=307972 RepID=A0A2G8L090_STIJA|nr:hypothetical protein BSL78_09434 [Apostichopus japonicus]